MTIGPALVFVPANLPGRPISRIPSRPTPIKPVNYKTVALGQGRETGYEGIGP
jgi:hypothetical protein